MKPIPTSYKGSFDSWQMKIQVIIQKTIQRFLGFSMPFPMPWLLIAGVIFICGYAIISHSEIELEAVRWLAINSILIAAIANTVIFYEMLLDEVADIFPDLLDEDRETSKAWVKRWYNDIFWSWKNKIFGILLGLLLVLLYLRGNIKIHTLTAWQDYVCLVRFLVGLLGGSMFLIMWNIGAMAFSLGSDVKIKPSIFDSDTSVLRAISSILWKVSFVAALVYVFGVLQIPLCSQDTSIIEKAVIVFFGSFVVLYFIIPQLNVHKTLIQLKRDRLTSLVEQIDRAFDNVSQDPTPQNISQLRDLFDVQKVVNGKTTWSFGTRDLLVLVGTVVIPLIMFILECIRDKWIQ